MKPSTVKLPTVLAFERKLECSDAFFNQANSNNLAQQIPVLVREKSVRGTISNALKTDGKSDEMKLDRDIKNPNPQTVETATLDADRDTLIVTWTLKILPFEGKPCMCNEKEYYQVLINTISGSLNDSIPELAHRYACNIANARWLWRNRVNAESIKITVENQNEKVEIANAKQIPLNEFNENAEIKRITKWIQQGFMGEQYTLLTITAEAKMGMGQEVFPSEELVLDKSNSKGGKSKVLYKNGQGKAGLHSQKIGNAIRTIDNWYPEAVFPIAAEPYGVVTTMAMVFRHPTETKQDFYTLFNNWIVNNIEPELSQKHYILAVLIRGGLFGASDKKNQKD